MSCNKKRYCLCCQAAEDVKDILEQMSKIRANCGWEFLFATDNDFLNRYPDIVQRQKMLWDAKYQTLCKQLKIPKEHEKKFKDKDQGNVTNEKPARRRRNSSKSARKRTLSGRSISDYSDVEMDTSTKSDLDNSADDTDSAIQNEPMEIQDSNHVSNGPVTMATNSNCDISNISVELKSELVNFVQEKLFSRFILTARELRRLFTMKQAQCPPGHVLNDGVSDKLLEEILYEVGGVKLTNQWPPNTTPEPLYALPKTGDKFDAVRGILLGMFNTSHKITRKNFLKLVEDELDYLCQKMTVNFYLRITVFNEDHYGY